MDQFPDLDPTDPEQLGQVSSALRQAGLYEQALEVGKQARDAFEKKKVTKGSGTEIERWYGAAVKACKGDAACIEDAYKKYEAKVTSTGKGAASTKHTNVERHVDGSWTGYNPVTKSIEVIPAPDVAMKPPEPPTVRDFNEGDETVTRQWNPETLQWEEFSTAPRWKPTEDKPAPHRTIKRGDEVITQEYIDGQWTDAEIAPRKPSVEVNINDISDYNKLADNYRVEIKPLEEDSNKIMKLDSLLRIEGGSTAEAVQSAAAELFGGQTRALAELQRWANIGDLPQRVINSASRMFYGEYSDQSKKDLMQLMRAYSKAISGKHEEINEKYGKVAERFRTSADLFVVEPYRIRGAEAVETMDFSRMSLFDLTSIDSRTLTAEEKTQLKNELYRRSGGQ